MHDVVLREEFDIKNAACSPTCQYNFTVAHKVTVGSVVQLDPRDISKSLTRIIDFDPEDRQWESPFIYSDYNFQLVEPDISTRFTSPKVMHASEESSRLHA